jgi:hypothetical protein
MLSRILRALPSCVCDKIYTLLCIHIYSRILRRLSHILLALARCVCYKFDTYMYRKPVTGKPSQCMAPARSSDGLGASDTSDCKAFDAKLGPEMLGERWLGLFTCQ